MVPVFCALSTKRKFSLRSLLREIVIRDRAADHSPALLYIVTVC